MRYISSAKLSTFGVLAFLFACSSTKTTELEGVPELATVEMALTNEPTSEGLATEADAIDIESLAADDLEQTRVPETTAATDLTQLRQSVRALNASLREALSPIAAMVRNDEPSRTAGKLKLWGPVTRGATEYRFFLRQTTAHQWGWRLDGRVTETTDAYQRLAAGTIAVGSVPRRGTGVMGFDFDAWATVDPTVTAQGRILLGFKHGELGTSVGYALRDFAYDSEAQPGVDALLRAVHLKNGSNRVRLAFHGNVADTATDAEELVLARVRHQPDWGGRSDLIATSGDVPDGEAWVISQCWDETLTSVFRVVRKCPRDGVGGDSCTVTQTSGNNADCPSAMTTAELPPLDPNGDMVDDDDPNGDVGAPSEIPEVEGE